LLGFSVFTNVDNDHDDEDSECVVDTDDDVWYGVAYSEWHQGVIDVVIAEGDWFVGFVLTSWFISEEFFGVSNGINQVITEALKGTREWKRFFSLSSVIVSLIFEVSPFFKGWVSVNFFNVVTINSWIFAINKYGPDLWVEDNTEWDTEKEDNEWESNECSVNVVSCGEVSVFPDNVCWFSWFNEEKIITEELSLCWKSLSWKSVFWFVFLGNDTTIFFFKSDESIAWLGQFSELFVFQCGDFGFNFSHLVVSLIHDVATSFSEEVNEFGIVEGEDDISDFNWRDLNVWGGWSLVSDFEEFVS
jgi:hypothetical protein